jgi:hypothetical protein
VYVNLAEVKSYLGVQNATDDSLLTALMSRSSVAIDNHCGRTFMASADSTRYFDAIRDVQGRMLLLDTDLVAITSITNGDGVAYQTTEYVTEPRNRTPYYAITLKTNVSRGWTYTDAPENAIAIVGKWAYSVAPPEDIKHACVRLVAYLYRQKDNSQDLDRTIIAGNTTILPVDLPSDLTKFLAPYRRTRI